MAIKENIGWNSSIHFLNKYNLSVCNAKRAEKSVVIGSGKNINKLVVIAEAIDTIAAMRKKGERVINVKIVSIAYGLLKQFISSSSIILR